MLDTRSTLLSRLKDRSDQTAWRTFDQLYRPMLIGYARGRGLEPADAEDVAQQCIAAVLEQIGKYEHTGSFRAWMRSIVEKRICDLFRRRRDQQADSAVWAQQSDPQPGPPEIWERHWWTAHLRHCAEAVRSDIEVNTYAAFVAYGIEGQPVAAVAQRLGMSANQVYVAKHRVLERIRGLMLELTGSEYVEALP